MHPRLKTILKPFLLLAFVISVSACSTHPVVQDYSSKTQFTNYQTYQWLPQKSSTLASAQPFIAKRIEQAIINNLHAKGAMIVREQPQAYISYDYRIHRTETLEPSTTVGVGFGSRHFGFGSMFPIEYETRVYEDAEWIVDIYDQNKQLIWRGKTIRPLETFNTPAEAEQHTQNIIDSILNQFPPK